MNYAYLISSAGNFFAEAVLWVITIALPAAGWWIFRAPQKPKSLP